MNRTKKKTYLTLISAVFLCFSQMTLAGSNMDEMSEGCKSCVRSYACSRDNKTCNANCQANLYGKQIDLDSCRGACIGKLEKCLLDANNSCSFYCTDK